MSNNSKTSIKISSEDDYDDMIWSIRNISFNKIRAIATDFVSELTEDEKDKLWDKLRRGKELLRKDAELKYYLYAYGKMHKQKMDTALSQFSWEDFDNKQIQILDWGCGQALATICFFDYLKRKDIKCNITKIILIEPSKEALERAATHVCAYDYVGDITDVITLKKYINDVELLEIKSNAELTIHFFSNVLDIPNVNIRRLARIVQKSSDNESVVICVGPSNNFNKRIDTFYTYFNNNELLYEFEHDRTSKYDYTAKYCTFALNRRKKDFDFDDAMTVREFFEANGVTKGKRSFLIKTCTSKDGEKFQTLGLANGNTTEDGRPAMTFFVLSQVLEAKGVVLNKAFVKEHKEDILVLEPIDGLKFGIILLSSGKEDWDDL